MYCGYLHFLDGNIENGNKTAKRHVLQSFGNKPPGGLYIFETMRHLRIWRDRMEGVSMKKFSFISAMLALVLVFGLALMSCEFSGSAGYGQQSGSGNDGGGTNSTTYTVNFHVGEGGGVAPFPIRNVTAGDYIELPGQGNMTHPSKTFSGWRSGGAFYSPNTRLQVFANLEFTAQWADATSGTPGTNNPGETNPGGTNPPAATENPFLGTWNHYTDEHYLVSLVFTGNNTVTQMEEGLFKGTYAYTYSGNTATIIGSDGDTFIAIVSGNTLTMVGDPPRIFTKNNQGTNPAGTTFTVSFNANGSSGSAPNTQTVNSGSSIIMPDSGSLSRGGFIFGGWNTNTSGTGNNLFPGASFTPVSDITFYAKWDIAVSSSPGSSAATAITLSTGAQFTLGQFAGELNEEWYTFTRNGGAHIRVLDRLDGNIVSGHVYTADVVIDVLDVNLNYVTVGGLTLRNYDAGGWDWDTANGPIFSTEWQGKYYVVVKPKNDSSSNKGAYGVQFIHYE